MKFQIPAKLAKPALKLQKASPKIMFVAGTAGVIAAGVMACRSTLKFSETLEPTEKKLQQAHDEALVNEDYLNGEYQKDLIKIKVHTVLNVAKLYAPAVGVAVISIGLLTSAHVVQNRRAAAMSAAYATLKEGYDRYRDRVTEKLGVEEEQKLRHGVRVVEEVVEGKDGKTKVVKHARADGLSPYSQLFTEGNANWSPNPENNWFFLNAQRNYWNDRLQAYGFVFLNEIHESLGMPRTKEGQVVGWLAGEKNGDGYIDFGIDADRNPQVREFMSGGEGSIWLDFNVDGAILDLI